MQISSTYISTIVLVIIFIASKFNITLGNEEVTSWIEAILVIISAVKILYERWKKGGVSPLGVRK
jgi:FtsH-binding integral membrane protein